MSAAGQVAVPDEVPWEQALVGQLFVERRRAQRFLDQHAPSAL